MSAAAKKPHRKPHGAVAPKKAGAVVSPIVRKMQPAARQMAAHVDAGSQGDAGFAERMMWMRKQRRLSLDQLAEASGLTKSFLSKVERKLAVPSITTAIKVARALGVRVSQLLGEPSDDAILIVRKGAGQRFVANGADVRNTHEALAAGRLAKRMEPFLLMPAKSYDPGTYDSDGVFSFTGEHFCFVISGEIEIDFPDRIVRLAAGDSIYFDSSIPHRTRSSGDEIGSVLVVVAPQ